MRNKKRGKTPPEPRQLMKKVLIGGLISVTIFMVIMMVLGLKPKEKPWSERGEVTLVTEPDPVQETKQQPSVIKDEQPPGPFIVHDKGGTVSFQNNNGSNAPMVPKNPYLVK